MFIKHRWINRPNLGSDQVPVFIQVSDAHKRNSIQDHSWRTMAWMEDQSHLQCPPAFCYTTASFAGEQFLHGALFDVTFFGDELLKGFNKGIRIAQRLSDGFLFGFGGRKWKAQFVAFSEGLNG